MMSKQQFMLKMASKDWNGSTECFVRVGTLKYLRLPTKLHKLRFSQLPEKAQKKLSKFAEHELEYSDDWQQYKAKRQNDEGVKQ